MQGAANAIAERALALAKDNIASSGKFGNKWTDGLKSIVQSNSEGATIEFSHDLPGFNVFEHGATIQGKPLLWIPLSYTGITTRAKDYPGGLFMVNRIAGGPPLLLSVVDKKPKYVGISSVTIPQKFHVGEIIEQAMKEFPSIFAGFMV
jgi:hypothetical protein